MFKMMLVEDEPEVINSMLENINWGKYNFSLPLGCRNGAEAIENLESGFVPDAVITDICMPLVDGLELTRYIREKLPDTLVVILSGHDEFSYAQEALQLKAYDYILKPITPQNLEKALKKLKEELDDRNLQDMDASVKIAGKHFLNRLLAAELDAITIENNCKRYDIAFDEKYYMVAVLDVDPWISNDIAGAAAQEVDLLRYGICNMAQELAENRKSTLVFQDNEKKIRIITGAKTPEECEKRMRGIVELVAENTQKHLKLTFSAGIGEIVSSPQSFYKSAVQAERYLKQRLYYGPGSILGRNVIKAPENKTIKFSRFEQRFEEAVNNFNHKAAYAVVTELLEEIKRTHLPFEKCLDYCQRLILLLLNFTASFVTDSEISTLEKAWEQHSLFSASFISHIELLMRRFMEQVFELQSLFCSDTATVQVVRAENYIQQNYANPKLSLQMITDYLALSTSYFSAIYKAKTGSTFVESLTKIRMQKAKQILKHTDQRTYETAEAVGFSDPQYFAAAFKRVTGMTPSEYREYSRKIDTEEEDGDEEEI